MLDDLFDYCFPILDKIGFKLDSIEDDVLEGRSEEAVRDISNAKQEIISYRKIIKPQRPALRLLERRIERFLPEQLELYFDDLVDASERIWDLLDNYKEVVEALETTNEQVLSHRFNDVLRILTVFSIVFLPATLIASLWGMNVGLPGGGDPATASTAEFWLDHRRLGRPDRRAARLLPLQALALEPATQPSTGLESAGLGTALLVLGAADVAARPAVGVVLLRAAVQAVAARAAVHAVAAG